MAKKIYRIIFLGPQGSGKGTQAKMLAGILKIPAISTGQIYRDTAKKRTVLGEKVSTYVHQGKLVPDDITNALVEKRLSKRVCAKGFILDGYPRNMDQVKTLDKITDLTHVILVGITDKESIYRIAGRIVCECGAIYHRKFKPPKKEGVCDKCGVTLTVRKDDKEELTLRKRLEIYHEQINPILNFYQDKNLLHEINGEQSIPDVHQDVVKIFK